MQPRFKTTVVRKYVCYLIAILLLYMLLNEMKMHVLCNNNELVTFSPYFSFTPEYTIYIATLHFCVLVVVNFAQNTINYAFPMATNQLYIPFR